MQDPSERMLGRLGIETPGRADLAGEVRWGSERMLGRLGIETRCFSPR